MEEKDPMLPGRGTKARFLVANVSSDGNRVPSTTSMKMLGTASHECKQQVQWETAEEEDGDAGFAAKHDQTMTYAKSLRHYMTRDALPSADHYRNLLSIEGGENALNIRRSSRPTLDDLHASKFTEVSRQEQADGIPGEENANKTGKVHKFGWIEGVYMRCLLNIWGVMLFLRLTWVIGQAGLIQGVLVLCLCNVVTMITTISMSAVCTNGQIKGGGIYYMISRSLGPEFGGAIGIMFTVANSIAVSMYVIGFCDSLLDMLVQYADGFNGIIGDKDNRINDIRVIGCATLFVILLLAVVGMDWVTRVQMGLLFLLVASQVDFIIGSFIPAEEEKKFGFLGYSIDLFKRNLYSDYHNVLPGSKSPPSFFTVFGVFFPAVTGIVAGANLSGDLLNPGNSIPKGTLLAILTTFITYVGYGIMIGGCTLSQASGDPIEYWAYVTGNTSIRYFDDCANRSEPCLYGSSNDQQAMTLISFSGYLIYAGCFAATLSSAIASLVGAPRVLQALAKDKLYPLIHVFSRGFRANNDPYYGYFLVFFISVGCILIGRLDTVSTLLTNFFVAAYALINFSVFHASVTKSPGWRPSFRYYNMWVSLCGTLLCILCMFLMDWAMAIITIVVIAILYLYIAYRKPEVNWGSSTQAQQFLLALNNVYSLNETAEHVKNYRPKIMLFTGFPSHRPSLVDFGHLITKKMSLLICAHVIKVSPTMNSNLEDLRNESQVWFKSKGIRAFYSASYAKTFEEGAKSCMNLAGLGKLSPNTILLGYMSNWFNDPIGLDEYINTIHHAFDLHLAVGILRLSSGCDFSQVVFDDQRQTFSSPLPQDIDVSDDNKSCSVSKITFSSPSKVNITTKINDEVNDSSKNNESLDNAKDNKSNGFSRFNDAEGNPFPKNISDINQFMDKKKKGSLDVWWLYDDGGLTLLLPYIMTTRGQFSDCNMRVFALASRKNELDRETRNMASLLAKFRIDFSDMIVIPDVTRKAEDETKLEFDEILRDCEASGHEPVNEDVLEAHKAKTNRHLRLAELLRQNSMQAEMIIMTLPMPRRGFSHSTLYAAWLEIMTRNMPPFLMVRGNQTSVLTFYS